MKAKKLLAGALSAVMLLGSMSFSAFAEATTLPAADADGVITITEDTTVDLASATVDKQIVIQNNAANVVLKNGTITSNNEGYVITVKNNANLTLDNMTIIGGNVENTEGIGAIKLESVGTVNLLNSTITAGDVTLKDAGGARSWDKPQSALYTSGEAANGSITITNCSLNGGKIHCDVPTTGYNSNYCKDMSEDGVIDHYAKADLSIVNSRITGGTNDKDDGSTGVVIGRKANGSTVSVKGSTISAPYNGIKLSQDLNDLTLNVNDNSNVKGALNGIYSTSSPAITVSNSKVEGTLGTSVDFFVVGGGNFDLSLNNAELVGANALNAMWRGSSIKADVTGTLKASGAIPENASLNGNFTLLVPGEGGSYVTAAASVNGTVFSTFAEAYEAATTGSTITLYQDAELSGGIDVQKNLTINGNGSHKLTFKVTGPGVQSEAAAFNVYGGSNFTFKNLELVIENQLPGTTTLAVFSVSGSTSKLTLDNVTMNVDGYSNGCIFYNAGNIEVINGSEMTVKNSKGVFKGEGAAATLSINKSSLNLENSTDYGIHNQTATIKDSTIEATGFPTFALSSDWTVDSSNVTISDVTYHGFSSGKLTLTNNSDMTVSGCGRNGLYLTANNNTVTENSSLTVKDCAGREITLVRDNAAITKDETSKIAATIERIYPQDLTGGVTVSYEDVTVNEGEKVYNLYVEADNKTINRLTSGEFVFELITDDAISYAVSGTKTVNVTPDSETPGRYLFNFNGVDAADITGKKINLGQIKFTGYGIFSFLINDGQVHATTLEDNIVTDYVKEPDVNNDKQDRLDFSEKLLNIEIKKPTRELTINVSFPNAVQDNVKSYQDMRVIINGGEESETIRLGSEEVSIMGVDTVSTAMTNGAYVIKRNLVKDMPYTVTVEGGGYRTASYTVRLSEDKTLNFWNNVKTTAANVEENKASSAKTTTFLAGELVKDGKINLYDLSAVVSYFGAKDLKTAHPEYAKYDLNRDGKIDSKDVSYILSSWGN